MPDHNSDITKMKKMKKRYVPCNLCGSEKYTILFEDELEDVAPNLDYNFSTETSKTYFRTP